MDTNIISIVISVLLSLGAAALAVYGMLSKYREEKRTSGFTTSYKLGFRVGDAAAKTMLKLV